MPTAYEQEPKGVYALTFVFHGCRLLEMVHRCFGSMAKTGVADIKAESLPVMLIVVKLKGSLEIKNIIQGV